ncbi:MAG: peptide ABC transporter substrate-binding protein [Chloroflexota bacterium]
MRKISHIFLTPILVFSLLIPGCELISAPSGKTLNLAGEDPITLDPALSGDARSNQYVSQIFSGLMRTGDEMEPVADIAESWRMSDDGKTYTFSLRKNAKFHDGSQVTAGDFKYSWERTCDPDTGSTTAVTYLGDIVGVKEMLSGKARELAGARVVSDFVLEVTIDAPKAYFLSKLTHPAAWVMDKANVDSSGEWWRHPNGTGPFKLKEWQERESLTLIKNSLYYGEMAKVDAVVFQLYTGVPIDLYETGAVDAAPVYAPYIYKATDKTGPFLKELKVAPELSFYYLGFNVTKPPFDDADIRRAFSMAIDKAKLASLVYHDTVEPAAGILPPGLPGFNPNLKGLGFDAAKAKALIAQSKYGDVSHLPPITVTTSGYAGILSGDLEAIIVEWRQNLGVEVKVRQIETERFLYASDEEKDEIFDMGWVADYPHPQNFLDVLFGSGAYYNYGRYSNPEIESLLEQASLEEERDKSLSIYREAEEKLVQDAACLPLHFGRNHYLVKPHVGGYQLNPLGMVRLNRVSLD